MSDLLESLAPYANRAVLLGLSGGADSVALLRALLEVGASVTAAHFDHRLRPESGEDAAWARELCASLGVEIETGEADVARVAREKSWNVEAAARRLRYAFLARAAKQRGLEVILTAHTLGDQAETVLYQLLRGEPTLSGIAEKRGHVERPWLGVPRADILAYLRGLNQPWREDSSNLDSRFTRNWLRAEVLPLLRERFPNLDQNFARHAKFASEDEALLEGLAARAPSHAVLAREPRPLLRRLVAQRLRAAKLPFHAGQVEHLADALQEGRTRHLTLPGGREVTVTGGALHLKPRDWPGPDFEVPDGLKVRHRLPGDRVSLQGGTRRLSDVLSDARVPRFERDRVWLLARGSEVRWIGLTPPIWARGAGENVSPWAREMNAALSLAHEAALAGEVPVGAVVVRGGQIVAGARNSSREAGDMTHHAELAALREAARVLGTPYLNDCTLVVTLEPCPMCFGAMIEARLGRVVFGADNPRLGALGGVADLSREGWGHVPEIVRGVRARECGELLTQFFVGKR